MIRMTRVPEECKKYNLDSVRVVFSGAAPLGEETILDMNKIWPKWRVAQGYGKGSWHRLLPVSAADADF